MTEWNLRPGQIATFYRISEQSVQHSFAGYKRANDLDWEITTWTEPPGTRPDDRAAVVRALRSDGLSQEQIRNAQGVSARAARPPGAYRTKFTLDPIAWINTFPPDERIGQVPNPRQTKWQWEHMAVGEKRTVPMATRDLRNAITKAMIQRGLNWTFRFERSTTTKDPKFPVWIVERIT
jgi:hypothetical protein